MRAVLYARVSSKAQRDRQTIENQLRVLPDFIAQKGWTLARPAETYVDDGKTAKAGHLGKRDAFTRLIADAAAGVFDVVCVVDQDRLTRSEDIAERGMVLGAFQRAGVKIAIATSGQVLDLSSSMGDLFSGLQAFFAAEENRKRRERTVAGKLRAIATGKKPAGPTPYGYVYSRQTGWSIQPEQAAVVREIFARVAAGESCESIGRDLDARGVGRPRGGRWLRERVWQTAVSRTYLGDWSADKGRGLSIAIPAILDEELWTAAQRAFTRQRRRGLARSKHVYLLEGIAACELCETRVGVATGTPAQTGRHRHTYYVCGHRRRPPREAARCTLPMRQVAEVDARVWDSLATLLGRRDLLERALAIQAVARGRRASTWRRDLEKAEAALVALERAEAAVLARFRRGVISMGAMDEELAGVAVDRARLEERAQAARLAGASAADRGAAIRSIQETVGGLRRRLGVTSPAERRRLAVALLGPRGVVLGPDAIRGTVSLRADVTGPACGAGSKSSQSTSHVVVELALVA